MQKTAVEQDLELLYTAFHSKYGILVHTSDPIRHRTRLYRSISANPELKCLSVNLSPDNPKEELWIVNLKGLEPNDEAEII